MNSYNVAPAATLVKANGCAVPPIAGVIDIPRTIYVNGAGREPLPETGRPPAASPPQAEAGQAAGVGHNSESALAQVRNATVFQQFEAIVDSPDYTSAQKCMLVKIRCRVNAKTMDGAIVSNEGLMRAASLKDPRALRAELRDLQGKARDLPAQRDRQGRPINDPVDYSRATIAVEERSGRAGVIRFNPERLHAIIAAYLQYREEKRGPGRPPASGAPPLSEKPPAPDAPPFPGKPPASGSVGLGKPPASHAENPLRGTHPDPFPVSGREEKRGAGAPADLLGEVDPTPKRPRKASKPQATVQEIEGAVTAYNAAAANYGFTRCTKLTEDRSNRLSARLIDIGGLYAFKRALGALAKNDFLMGKVPPRNGGTPFKLDIDRLLSTGSGMGDVLAKLLDAAGDAAPPTGPSLAPHWWRDAPSFAASLEAADWQLLYDTHAKSGIWPGDMMGPPPGVPGCLIPRDVIAKLKGVAS